MKSTIRWILMAACLFAGSSIRAQVPQPANTSAAASTNAPDTSYLKGMPSPDRLLAEIHGTNKVDTATRQLGALYQMHNLIDIVRNAPMWQAYTADEQQFVSAYKEAEKRVEVPLDDQGRKVNQQGSPLYTNWWGSLSHYELDESYRHELEKQFFSDAWRSNYGPILAKFDAGIARMHRENENSKREAEDMRFQARVNAFLTGTFLLLVAGGLVLALVLLAYPLFAMRGVGGSKVPPLTATPGPNFQVPESLRNVQLFKKQYQLAVTHGFIEQKEGWTETRNWTSTSGGQTYSSGGTTYTTPITHSHHSSSTVYHRYWLRTPSGEQTWVKFTDDSFPALPGQVISFVTKDKVVWMAYNHSMKSFVPFSKCWETEHRHKTSLFARILVLVSGLYCILAPALFGPWLLFLLIWWPVTSSVNRRISRKRNEQFTQNYFPALRSYIEQCSLRLTGSFLANPAAPPVIGSQMPA